MRNVSANEVGDFACTSWVERRTYMVIQIAFGIFFGVILLCLFAIILLAIAFYFGKREEKVPHFIKEPKEKPRKHKSTIQDWWDRYDDDEDWN